MLLPRHAVICVLDGLQCPGFCRNSLFQAAPILRKPSGVIVETEAEPVLILSVDLYAAVSACRLLCGHGLPASLKQK